MIFLPIVERELRLLARRPSTYWARVVVASLVLLMWFALLFGSGARTPPHLLGQNLVNALGILVSAFCLLAGVTFTADCLSEEKRNGTLGLLFLTDLKSIDVVLGKLAATSLQGVYGLLVIFPVMALSMLLGGVTLGEFGRLSLALLNALVFSLSAGMLVSALSEDARFAWAGTFLVVVVCAGILPAIWWLQHALFPGWFSAQALLFPSPGYVYLRAFDPYYRAPDGHQLFWGAFSSVALLGLMFLALSCALLPRAWRTPGPLARTGAWRNAWWQLRFGTAQSRAHRRAQAMGRGPVYWLGLRDRLAPVLAWGILGVFLPPWFFLLAASVSSKPLQSETLFLTCMLVAYGLHQTIKALVALEASRCLSEDRESGAWELILVTPLAHRSIVRGLRQALQAHFRRPLMALSATNLGLVSAVILFPMPLGIGAQQRSIFLVLFIGGGIALFLDAWALSWAGLAAALRAKRHHRAVLATLGRVMLVPWLVIFLWIVWEMNGRGLPQKQARDYFVVWFALGAVVDLWVAARAYRRVRRELGY